MTLPGFHLKRILAILLSLVLLSACALPGAAPPVESSSALRTIQTIALLPVVFNDDPINHFVQLRVGEEILWQTRRTLKSKGYRVIPEDRPALDISITPFAPELNSPASLATMASSTADAILLVRIDHFLDAGMFAGDDDDSAPSIDIYATAQLILQQEKRLVWQRESSGSTYNSALIWSIEITAARDLVDHLLTPLPAAFVDPP